MDLQIFDAKLEDFNSIYPLLKQLWPDSTSGYKELERVYITYLNSERQRLIVGKMNDKIVGFCSLTIRNNFWQAGNVGHVDELVIDKEFRGQGLGKILLHRITEIAIEGKCKLIELDSAFHRIEAHNFYESIGYQKIAYVFSKKIEK